MDNVADAIQPRWQYFASARTVENEFTELVPSTKASKHFYRCVAHVVQLGDRHARFEV